MSLAEPTSAVAAALRLPVLERVRGVARIGMRATEGVTRLEENFQSGSAKARFPKPSVGGPLEVTLLNTAGGVTGGDRLSYAVSVGPGARGIASTQAAERIYRRSDGFARIETALTVEDGASLDWLPQETILFDRSALTRTLTADVAPTGRLLAVESIVLGRTAMGEQVRTVTLADSWRIRRGGRIVFADGLRLDGDSVGILAGGATGKGAVAVATLVLVAPDAEAMLEPAREALAAAPGEAGASAWNGILVARLMAASGQALRTHLIPLIEALRGVTMPRVWLC
jgi:urease accessory protein